MTTQTLPEEMCVVVKEEEDKEEEEEEEEEKYLRRSICNRPSCYMGHVVYTSIHKYMSEHLKKHQLFQATRVLLRSLLTLTNIALRNNPSQGLPSLYT